MTPPRCEAGAWYEGGRVRYACPNRAEYQVVVVDPDTLLLVWCAEHAEELGPTFGVGHPKVRVEPWKDE